MEGWICLHRSLISHWVWQDPLTLKAWIDLLMMANIKDSKALINGKLTTIKRGQCMASIRQLSIRWECSREKAKKILLNFESDNMIVLDKIIGQKNDKVRPLITISNYKAFQDVLEDKKANKVAIKVAREVATDLATEFAHNNKDNKDNKDNNNRERSRFTPPSLQEVIDYCIERKNNISPQKFVSHYESNGWMIGKNKMKDWKAAVRTWEQRDKEEVEQNKQKPKNQSLNFMQREYTDDDIRALERKKLGLT